MKRTIIAATILTTLTGSVLCSGTTGHAEVQQAPPESAAPHGQGDSPAALADSPAALVNSPVIRLQVPIFSTLFDTTPVALVNDEKITIAELVKVVTSRHEGMTADTAHGKRDYSEPLNRLINAKLIVQEARAIELGQLPEIKDMVKEYREKMLREVLFLQQVKDVTPDEKEVEKLYREAAREWKVSALTFATKDAADKFLQEVKAGKSFEDMMTKTVTDGLLDKARADAYMLKADTDPRISRVIIDLKIGGTSPVIGMDKDFLVFRLDDVRIPEKPELRQQARQKVLSNSRLKELNKMKADLLKKYVKRNDKLIKSVDFEAKKPGFAKLLKDKRVLATVKGGRKVTVGDLAQGIGEKYFHGVETAIREKKVNLVKLDVLDELLSQIVFRQVAMDQGLDKSDAYLKQVDAYESSLLFGAFVEKAIRPEIVTRLADLEAYYAEHVTEYTTPEMLKIDEIVFKTGEDAQAAVDKLRKNMDFKWLKDNTAGQLDKDAAGQLHFGGQLLMVTSLPEDVRKLLAGAREGEFKFYKSPEGQYYVLYVQQVVPAKQATLDEVSDTVVPAVYNVKLGKAVDSWTSKLRAASDIKIYLYKGE